MGESGKKNLKPVGNETLCWLIIITSDENTCAPKDNGCYKGDDTSDDHEPRQNGMNGYNEGEDISSVPLPWHEIMGFRVQDAKTDKPKEYYSESIHED